MRTIAQVIDYGGVTGGSFIPALISLCRCAQERSERFVVIARKVTCATWPAELQEAGADVHAVRSPDEVGELLRQIRPDIVHSHFHTYDRIVLSAPRGTRIFWHVHSHRQNKSAVARMKAYGLYRIIAARAESFVTVSHTLAAECIAFGAPAERVRTVQNGIDTQMFRPPSPAERAAARAQTGITGTDPVVLFFERAPYKGGATVKRAIEQLPACRLLVAGGTHAQRAAFGAAPKVIGIERAADARNLYWAADILAFASDNEAFGFVLAEALACGLRVVASDIPVVREICGNVQAVRTFPARDAGALAGAIARLLEEEPGENGRSRIVEHFNLRRWTQQMMALYA